MAQASFETVGGSSPGLLVRECIILFSSFWELKLHLRQDIPASSHASSTFAIQVERISSLLEVEVHSGRVQGLHRGPGQQLP